jgi:hypothetical protein
MIKTDMGRRGPSIGQQLSSPRAYKRSPALINSTWYKGMLHSQMAGTADNNGAFDFVISKMRRGTEEKKCDWCPTARFKTETGDHELLIELLRSRLLLQKPLYIRLLTLRNPCCRKVVSPPITDLAKAAKAET